MDTNRLIDLLAADNSNVPVSMTRSWLIAGVIAISIAGTLFFAILGPRADFNAVAATPRFVFKFVVALTLLFTATRALRNLARPEADGSSTLLLLLAPAMLVLASIVEMFVVPADQLQSRWIGTNALLCLTFIPLIGVGPLTVAIIALRRGAPTRPAIAGAVSGFAAGGIAATFYAAHCFDDSPLFVATWYTLAVLFLGAIGAAAARLWVRW